MRCSCPTWGRRAAIFRAAVRANCIVRCGACWRLFTCHDYPPDGRAPRWEASVAEQRAGNIHIRDGVTEAQFVAMRTARDATLSMPTLLLPAIQVNLSGGRLPPPEDNGVRYLKIPIDTL